jgi:hypothetical protein
MAQEILLIMVHFGKLPPAIELTLETCKFNPHVQWLFVSDQVPPVSLSRNITFIRSSLEEFRKLVESKLGLNIPLRNPYKICDFRPAFGIIFSDHITGFTYWGHCDADVIYGDVYRFLSPLFPNRFDIISTLDFRLNGPLTLFRNSEKVNQIFRRHPEYVKFFKDPKNLYVFDEYLLTPIVKELASKNEIRIYFDSTGMQRHEFHSGLHVWKNGKIIEVLSGHEAMFFHYGGWKQNWRRAGRSEKWTEGRSWALMKQGLFMIKAEDTSGALQKVYEKHVERGKSPIVLELPWLRRTAHAIRTRNPLRSRTK